MTIQILDIYDIEQGTDYKATLRMSGSDADTKEIQVYSRSQFERRRVWERWRHLSTLPAVCH